MQKDILSVKDLVVEIDHKTVLNKVNLTIKPGEIHALMGPNGSGKSTLSQVIAGNPFYQVRSGEIEFKGEELNDLDPTTRALKGIFLSFQYPLEIPGVSVTSFLRMIYNKKTGENLSPVKFRELLQEKMKIIDMKKELTERYLNDGFSGGEKKRMEILQMLILKPELIILDEVDSGLDIDALKSVANGVNWFHQEYPESAFIVITHYARILHYIKPGHVHIMQNGHITQSGGFDLSQKLEETGYKDFGLEEEQHQ